MFQIPDPDLFWPQRWAALKLSIHKTIEKTGTPLNHQKLLTALDDFGDQLFNFFYYGFSHDLPNSGDLRLIKDRKYPPDHVLRAIIDQVAIDYEVIQRSLHQRMEGTKEEKETLELVDRWSRALLKPFSEDGPDNNCQRLLDEVPVVISYFSRSPRIRMIPYANVVLLGIPLTTILPGNRRDLLAVPHELGHYVYRHGNVRVNTWKGLKKSPVKNELAGSDVLDPEKEQYILHWMEELFADVFAMAATGDPNAMVHWVLSMIKDNAPGDTVKDFGVHPIDIVRMYIYLDPSAISASDKILIEKLGEKPTDAFMEKFFIFKYTMSSGKEGGIKLSQLREKLQKVTRIIREIILIDANQVLEEHQLYKKLLPILNDEIETEFGDKFSGLNIGGQSQSNEVSASMLLQIKLVDSQGSNAILAGLEPEIDGWYEEFDSRHILPFEQKEGDLAVEPEVVATHFDIMDECDIPASGTVEPEKWVCIFRADGWTTKGPETRPVGSWEHDPDWRSSAYHR